MDEYKMNGMRDLPQAFADALEHWREEALSIWEEKTVDWYAKGAHTIFEYQEKRYDITPEDVYPKAFFDRYPIGSLHACFELLQPMIGKDLGALGAEKIYSYGFLD